MKVAILGRTAPLLDAARLLLKRGDTIGLVWTSRAEAFYGVDESDFEKLAKDSGAAFRFGAGLNRENSSEYLRSLKLDVAVSVNWPTRISSSVFDCFCYGILNAHVGDLPRYRGNASANWAIINGEPHVGLCVHQMVEELDAGAVILRDRFPLDTDTYIGDVYDWFAVRVPAMFSEALAGLESGRVKPQPQPADPALSLRCYPRRPDDSRLQRDWDVKRVYRMVRASSHPFSGAFCFLEGDRRVTVWRAMPEPGTGPFLAVPGQVCYQVNGDPVIACGDGMLRLTDVEIEGGIKGSDAKALICSSMRNRLT